MFDQRLKAILVKIVDVSYGGENGFNQAIELAGESLLNVKFIQEKKLISQYFEEISQDSGKFCYGVQDTLQALELGAVHTLIVWENLEHMRYTLKPANGEDIVKYLSKQESQKPEHFLDPETSENMEVIEAIPLIEWFANNYRRFGALLQIVTNKSQEGSQFCKGFGGIGGLLRYRVDFGAMDYDSDE